mmetsp:Transcript_125126/g.267081  ORF Transcript_125126/g.267081 Transcript_125126/m.267081 type:complete len:220 (-) Transcript_125126:268-927(-)
MQRALRGTDLRGFLRLNDHLFCVAGLLLGLDQRRASQRYLELLRSCLCLHHAPFRLLDAACLLLCCTCLSSERRLELRHPIQSLLSLLLCPHRPLLCFGCSLGQRCLKLRRTASIRCGEALYLLRMCLGCGQGQLAELCDVPLYLLLLTLGLRRTLLRRQGAQLCRCGGLDPGLAEQCEVHRRGLLGLRDVEPERHLRRKVWDTELAVPNQVLPGCLPV